MLTDPQSITYNSVAKSLVASSRGVDQSEYRLNDAGTLYELRVGHTFKARNRVFARLARTSAVTDPLVPANNILASMTATLTIDFPLFGLAASDANLLGNALVGWASSAQILKMLNGET